MPGLEYRLLPGDGISALTPKPTGLTAPPPGYVRVAVHAVSLNSRDLQIVAGGYPVPHNSALVPCSDGAGVVTEIGEGITHLAVGDRVVGSFFRDWQSGVATARAVATSHGCEIDGWLATDVTIKAECLARVPDTLSFAAAACAPCAGVTAWSALVEFAQLKPGSSVVVQGTGGVATWAAQIASASGLRCIGTSSSVDKLERISSIERSDRINYVSQDWPSEVLRLTDGRGADLVVELGGLDTINQSLQAVSFGGRVAVIGGLSGWKYADIQPLDLITKNVALQGIYVGSTRSLQNLLRFVEENKIQPVIAETFQFDQAQEAFTAFSEARHVGKIVIQVRSEG